jgi:hypothetical protein
MFYFSFSANAIMEDPSQLPSKPPIGFGSMDQPHQGNYQ